MKINKRTEMHLFYFVLTLFFSPLVLAEDTEIYIGNGATATNGVQPNVLFMLDTSGSMTNKDGTGVTRLDRMKDALRSIINQSNNVNMGLMRFHREGGPILYPVTDINEEVVDATSGSASDLVIPIQDSSDDAEQLVSTGTPILTDTRLEMTKILTSVSSVNLSVPIATGNDDVEEATDGLLDFSSSDLELMNESTLQKIGLRFTGVAIPVGATITDVSIEFQMDQAASSANESLAIKIVGHKVLSSPGFSGSFDISNRISSEPTLSSVIWSPDTGLSVGDKLETNGLTNIVQEIIDQPSWSAGSPLTFLLELDSAGSGGKREVESENGTYAPVLKVSYEVGGIDDEQKIGLRFQTVMIPKGATITSAVLEFEAASTQAQQSSLQFHGEAIDDSPTFSNNSFNISGRTLTASRVDWNDVAVGGSLTAWTADERYQSPDLSTIIQEQVSRAGWCGGQSLSIIVSGTTGSLRKVKSYDDSSTAAPVLRVSYDPDTVPDPSCMNQVVQSSIGTGNDDAEEDASGDMDLGSSDLELINDGSDQTIGLRFTNLIIPQGATIISANLVFSNDIGGETQSGALNLSISAEDVDDSAAFSTVNSNLSSRSLTSSVSWSPTTWDTSTRATYRSNSIQSIVQAIVNRAGWARGNAMSFILTGSGGKRVANSFNGEAALATRLVIMMRTSSGNVVVQTVRDKLIETVNNLNYKGGTPILDVMYEAALYYRGEDVLYGRTRGFGAEIAADQSNSGSTNYTLGDGSISRNQYTRISTPLSWTGSGTVSQPASCTADNPNSSSCVNEHIVGEATYISPITESCQANYQILLSDGSGYGTNSVDLTNSMMTNTPTCSGHNGCAEALSGFLHTEDQTTDFNDSQTVATYTIGFNLDGTNPDFLQDIANAGGGTYSTASSSDELVDAFQTILSEVLTSTSSFSAPTVSVNAFNKIFHDNDVYFSTFLPSAKNRWVGNLKKYEICQQNEATCVAGDIIGVDRIKATTTDGQFKDTARSFWSSSNDGQDVEAGGAGAEISYPRKVYIENGTDITVLTENVGTVAHASYSAALRTLLDTTSLSDGNYLDMVKWILGQDIQDEDDDNSTTDQRWAFADALHSQPLVLTYGKDNSGNVIKKIFIGTNDGVLRMINASTGAEEWAFMPEPMTSEQNSLMINATGDHTSGVDGNIRSYITDLNQDGIIDPVAGDKVYIYFGMRRGGRHVYALDVTPAATLTDTDATTGVTPNLLWKIQGGSTAGFEVLGQTWSTPQVDAVWYDGQKKVAVMFAGGYHTGQDTTYGPSAYGNAVYVVDAVTGDLLWRGDETGVAVGSEDVAQFTEMKYPIPSDLAVFDTNSDGVINRVYVGDTGGQLWRIDLEDKNGGMKGTGARLVKTVEPDAFDVIAAEDERKFFYPPDMALVRDNSFSRIADFDLLTITSGNRSSPNDKVVHNRIYMFRDYVISGAIDAASQLTGGCTAGATCDTRLFKQSLTESDLYDATENLIQDSDGTSQSVDAQDEVALLNDKDGWYISLIESDDSWIGEKGLSSSVIINGLVFLTTYIPSSAVVADEQCASPIEGSGRIYALNILNGAAEFPRWANNVGEYERADRVYLQNLTGIPSSPVVRLTENGPEILVGGGGGIIQVDPEIELQILRSHWKEQ